MNDLAVVRPMSIDAVIERRNLMVEFCQKALLVNTDYGKVPGTEKNTLLKPGAEKLCTFFGYVPRYEPITTTEDWTGAIGIYQTLLQEFPDRKDWQARLRHAANQKTLAESYLQAG